MADVPVSPLLQSPITGVGLDQAEKCALKFAACLREPTNSALPLLPGTFGLEHDDLRGCRERRLADGQRVAGEMLRGEPSREGFDKDKVIPVVHRNSDPGLELLQDFTG